MNRFTLWMEELFHRSGGQGIVPNDDSSDDYTEEFDSNAEPEQYSEFWDAFYLYR